MDNKIKNKVEDLKNVSPLEATKILENLELYEKKSSQEIIDEVYAEFQGGSNLKNEVLKPVFTSVIDGLLEATSAGRVARKKGLTATRVVNECEHFTYDGVQNNKTVVNNYTEYKNARENNHTNSNMTQDYNKENRNKLYEDKVAMDRYKEDRVLGEKTLVDEYTGKKNLYHKRHNPNLNYNDKTHRKQAQPDHIVPLKQIHDKFKSNYALDDSDIKKISNIDDNFAVTSAEINQVKKEMSNKEYIKYMEKKGKPLDTETKNNMLRMEKEAKKAINAKANETVMKNLFGKGEVNKESYKKALEEYKRKNNGAKPSNQEEQAILNELKKQKTHDIRKTAVSDAAKQGKDYAVGNLILFIIKPVYYEISDIITNGMIEGVNADSTFNALKIRFTRVKNHVLTNAVSFLGENMWEFVKGFVSSLIEGIISLFTGVFKQVLKLIKEGIRIFAQSAKILFGKDSKSMSQAQKGDAIIKLLGGSIIAIAGIGIEALINKIGIGEPWSVVLATMISGIASALFMYLLNKADIFSVKAEKRRDRINEIFDERINQIRNAAENCNVIAIETLSTQRRKFEVINGEIQEAFKSNDISNINNGLYKMAEFMNIGLGYSNTEEFCEFMDSTSVIKL